MANEQDDGVRLAQPKEGPNAKPSARDAQVTGSLATYTASKTDHTQQIPVAVAALSSDKNAKQPNYVMQMFLEDRHDSLRYWIVQGGRSDPAGSEGIKDSG